MGGSIYWVATWSYLLGGANYGWSYLLGGVINTAFSIVRAKFILASNKLEV